MESLRTTRQTDATVLDQVGRQLRDCLAPSSNQVAMLAAVGHRHRRALAKAAEQYLDRRRALQVLILAPVEGSAEGTGEVQTALRVTNKSHQAVVAAAVGVAREIRSVLTARQRMCLLEFQPLPKCRDRDLIRIRQSSVELNRLEQRMQRAQVLSESDVLEARTAVDDILDAFAFAGQLQTLGRRMAGDAVWFWGVLPSLRPRGVLSPKATAGLAGALSGLDGDDRSAWCLSLAQAFDSAVLPACDTPRRLVETALGLVVLSPGFTRSDHAARRQIEALRDPESREQNT